MVDSYDYLEAILTHMNNIKLSSFPRYVYLNDLQKLLMVRRSCIVLERSSLRTYHIFAGYWRNTNTRASKFGQLKNIENPLNLIISLRVANYGLIPDNDIIT